MNQTHADGITVEKNISYLGPTRSEKMDVYFPGPEFKRPLPVVIWIHGGGWKVGDKAEKREVNICKALAEQGYAAVSFNYKLGHFPKQAADASQEESSGSAADPEIEIPWPQNIYDCKSALRYVRKESSRLGIDPHRIAVSGGSAGGHLALLVGLSADFPEMNAGGLYVEQDNHVSCIIDLYGVCDIMASRHARHFAGATPEQTTANLKAASPSTYLSKATPPILILHGDKDGSVPIRYSRDFVKLLELKGVRYEFVEVPGAPHSFDFQPKEMDLRPIVFKFLEKNLIPSSP